MGIQKSRCVGCFSEHTNMETSCQIHYYLVSRKCAQENNLTRKRLWRSGRVSEIKHENVGSLPGGVTFEPSQLCRRSSTFVKLFRKSSIFIVKFSSGLSETFFDTCVNWSCVTRCGCRTTSSTLFTVYMNVLYCTVLFSFLTTQCI